MAEINTNPEGVSGLPPVGPKPKRLTYWKQLAVFSFFVIIFWTLEFFWQYFRLLPGVLDYSLIRSFGITGATCVGMALLLSVIFKFFPRTAQYWRYRRYFGVSGFIFISFHVASVEHFYFNYDLQATYFSFNPFRNPIVFGTIAYPILLAMAATSTDRMVSLLGRHWKFIHRFVYIAYGSAIFHFVSMNPLLYKNAPGFLLFLIAGAAVCGHVFWFVKTILRRGWHNWGFAIGLAIISAFVIVGLQVWLRAYA